MVTVDLLRHGELVGGIKYRGSTDDPLTEAGRQSMERVWSQLAGSVGRIVTSPLARCAEPATAWAEEAGVPLSVDSRVAEMYYGDWEGLTKDEIRTRYPGWLEQWRSNPEGMRIPNAETAERLRVRIAEFWGELLRDPRAERILIVAHSGSLRMLVTHVLGAPIASTRNMELPYASWSRIEIDDDGNGRVLFLNRQA